jgi:hypothetical protein
MMNLAQWMAERDPHYIQKSRALEMEIRAKYDIANYNNQTALDREHIRGRYTVDRQNLANQNARDLEEFKAHKEDARLDKTIGAQTTLEKLRGDSALGVARLQGENNLTIENMRGENARGVEQLRGENSLALSNTEHKNAIARMEEDLRGQIAKAGFDSGVLAVHTTIAEDNKKRTTLIAQMEARTALRSRVQEKLIDAVIKEKLAQKQHARDMERLDKESELRRFETFWNSLSGFIMGLYQQGKQDEARAEIDRQLERWRAV